MSELPEDVEYFYVGLDNCERDQNTPLAKAQKNGVEISLQLLWIVQVGINVVLFGC